MNMGFIGVENNRYLAVARSGMKMVVANAILNNGKRFQKPCPRRRAPRFYSFTRSERQDREESPDAFWALITPPFGPKVWPKE